MDDISDLSDLSSAEDEQGIGRHKMTTLSGTRSSVYVNTEFS
jgi:hypothetical protein